MRASLQAHASVLQIRCQVTVISIWPRGTEANVAEIAWQHQKYLSRFDWCKRSFVGKILIRELLHTLILFLFDRF